jgi:hypothetical protein
MGQFSKETGEDSNKSSPVSNEILNAIENALKDTNFMKRLTAVRLAHELRDAVTRHRFTWD